MCRCLVYSFIRVVKVGTLLTALNRFKIDYINSPLMTTKEEKPGHWVVDQLDSAGLLVPGMNRLHLDSKYWACSKKEFEGWIEWDWTNKKRYVSEEYDCDNFAFSFKARCDRKIGINTVGLVIDYSGGHAYNLVCFTDAPVTLYEPQNDTWKEKGQSKMYTFTDGYIVL